MSFTVEELNPKKPVLVIDKKEILLSLVTLQHDVIIKEKFGSLSKMFDFLAEDPKKIVEVIWILVVDKPQFQNSFEVFNNFALSSDESIVDWSKRMVMCLQESVSKSMPLIRNEKRYKDIQEIKGATTDEKPCYAGYFDAVAKRYGYTLEKFYELTLRQLHIILKTIGDKSYDELEVQAALAGRQLKPRLKFDDISKEEEKENEDQAMDALKRLQEEYKKKQAKDN